MKLIHWPTFLRDTGEGGTVVYAAVKSDDEGFQIMPPGVLQEVDPEAGKEEDAHGPIWPLDREWFPGRGPSVLLAALVKFGEHKASWWDKKKDRMWVCDKDELTADGKRLLEELEAIYGEVTLTFRQWERE